MIKRDSRYGDVYLQITLNTSSFTNPSMFRFSHCVSDIIIQFTLGEEVDLIVNNIAVSVLVERSYKRPVVNCHNIVCYRMVKLYIIHFGTLY